MKCENCEFLAQEGSACEGGYPEQYCSLGISNYDANIMKAFDEGDGCSLTRPQRYALKDAHDSVEHYCEGLADRGIDIRSDAMHVISVPTMENSLHKLMGMDYTNCCGTTHKEGYQAFYHERRLYSVKHKDSDIVSLVYACNPFEAIEKVDEFRKMRKAEDEDS